MRKAALYYGFTMIELLIVVAIMSILTGAILPGFNSYIINQNLRQAQEQLKNDLRSTQIKALAGSFSDNLNVKYWGVHFRPDSGTYDYFTSLNTTDPILCTDSYNTTTYILRSVSTKLPSDLRYTGSSHRCVFFNNDNGDIVNTGAVIVGASGATSNCRRVEMNGPGRIIINLTNMSCS
jgi:prepilin-type N-terminal cleavage/methylation domain-containing protein